MKESLLLQNRLRELADKSYSQIIYTYSGFLSLAEQEDFHAIERELHFASPALLGGYENAERCLVCFGSEENLGYAQDPPIVCIHIKPLLAKFADSLSHRDFLGALMNLGIERSTLGDIKVGEKEAYLFCLESMAPYILEQLQKVKHTNVTCEIVQAPSAMELEQPVSQSLTIPSLRIDVVIAKVCHLSRSEALKLFTEKKVYLNGRLCENNAKSVQPEDMINARGYGKFKIIGETGVSRKGKLNISIAVYR